MIRKIIFWIHLIIGIATGIVALGLCVTGAILAFEKPIVDWAESNARALPPAGVTGWVSPDVLLASAAKMEPATGAAIQWFSDPRMPVRILYRGRPSVLLNASTGEVIGRGADSLQQFFNKVTQLHVNFLLNHTGGQIVDVANACFAFLLLSGLYLWWPRVMRWKALKNALTIRLRARGRARDWNWHNSLGFWFLLPLFFMSASGLVLSFGPVDKWWRSFAASHVMPIASHPAPPILPAPPPKIAPSWNDLMHTVQQQYPGWHSIMVIGPIPSHGVVSLNVNKGQMGQRTQSYTIKLDTASNTILTSSGWAEQDAGIRARLIARLGHTGEILGLWGQALALAGCLVGVVVIYTGFALSCRRFFGRKHARPAVSVQA